MAPVSKAMRAKRAKYQKSIEARKANARKRHLQEQTSESPKISQMKRGVTVENEEICSQDAEFFDGSIQNDDCVTLTNEERSSQEAVLLESAENEGGAIFINKETCTNVNTSSESATRGIESPVLQSEETPELIVEVADKAASTIAVEGRRIVNLMNVYSKLQDISTHGPFNCNLKSVDIIYEKQVGLHSTFTLQCKLCNIKFYISSDEGSEMNVNNCAVLGTAAIGCGLSQLQELSASLSLPLMGESTYAKCHKAITDMWDGISVQTMNDAAKEEREIAVSEGQVDENGVPYIDVIVDGCWSKRSYKKNYSALSGAAVIIGKRTGKVLFIGVKNKYCCICAQAQYKKETPREHNCYKNYSGPSTGMESTILVEGFKCSVEMHGLIYKRMISDGDSSTHSKLIEARPYSNITVQKIECKNHIMRNMCNKLTQLKTDTKYPPRLRKNITDQKILSIRRTMKKAMEKYTSNSESDKRAHIEYLYNDILLAHAHAFGDHSRCKNYFCDKVNEKDSYDPDFMTSSLWSKICQIMSNVASHAPSLIHNVESNKVENFNSKIAKLVGGKRINFSLRGAYENRCKGAVVSHNTRALLSMTYKRATGMSPKGQMKMLEERRLRKTKLIKRNIRKKLRFLQSKEDDCNYGENCTREDIAPEIMEKEKATFIMNLTKTASERDKIQKDTILQSASSEWLELRRKLLTASNFGRVVKRRQDVSCKNLVKDLLYKGCISHVKSIKHGIDNEKIAIEQLSKQENITIKPCGLFLDEKIPYLGASPDGVCEENNMIVEIKCPVSAYKSNFEEAVKNKKVPFFKLNDNGNLSINTNHNWYHQIQGQLHITKRSKCLFGLWLGENIPMKTVVIPADEKFWTEKMVTKLKSFYWDCILPELIDPRHTRKMPIRDPSYIQEAIENKTKKVNKSTDQAKRKNDEDHQLKSKIKPKKTKCPEIEVTEQTANKKIKNKKKEEKENITIFPNDIESFGEISDDDEEEAQIRKRPVLPVEMEKTKPKPTVIEKTKEEYNEISRDELIDPQHTRKMPIRDPSYIQEAIENRTKKVNKSTDQAKRKNDEDHKLKSKIKPKKRKCPEIEVTEKTANKKVKNNKKEEKENITDFPNVIIESFGEISDDDEEEAQIRKRPVLPVEMEKTKPKPTVIEKTKEEYNEISRVEERKQRKILAVKHLNFN